MQHALQTFGVFPSARDQQLRAGRQADIARQSVGLRQFVGADAETGSDFGQPFGRFDSVSLPLGQ